MDRESELRRGVRADPVDPQKKRRIDLPNASVSDDELRVICDELREEVMAASLALNKPGAAGSPAPPAEQESQDGGSPDRPRRAPRFLVALDICLENNDIGSAGVRTLCAALASLAEYASVRILRLFKNRVDDEAGAAIASIVRANLLPIQEIHLSHCRLTLEGLKPILLAIRDQHGRKPGHLGPLWLRVEYNKIDDGACLDFMAREGVSYCFAKERGGACDIRRCHLRPGPMVHLPWLQAQRVSIQFLFQRMHIGGAPARPAHRYPDAEALGYSGYDRGGTPPPRGRAGRGNARGSPLAPGPRGGLARGTPRGRGRGLGRGTPIYVASDTEEEEGGAAGPAPEAEAGVQVQAAPPAAEAAGAGAEAREEEGGDESEEEAAGAEPEKQEEEEEEEAEGLQGPGAEATPQGAGPRPAGAPALPMLLLLDTNVARRGAFGAGAAGGDESEAVVFLITDTVRGELDGLKHRPDCRRRVSSLFRDDGYVNACKALGFLEVLDRVEGEDRVRYDDLRVVSSTPGRSPIVGSAPRKDKDGLIIDVALLVMRDAARELQAAGQTSSSPGNGEAGAGAGAGPVNLVLLSGDAICCQRAREAGVPAASWSELDANLRSLYSGAPWTASALRACLPSAAADSASSQRALQASAYEELEAAGQLAAEAEAALRALAAAQEAAAAGDADAARAALAQAPAAGALLGRMEAARGRWDELLRSRRLRFRAQHSAPPPATLLRPRGPQSEAQPRGGASPQALPSFPTPPVAAFDAAPLEERAMTKKYEWPEGAEIKLLYDGECPHIVQPVFEPALEPFQTVAYRVQQICVKEVDFLKSKDKAGKIIFEDIADPNYDPAMNGGVSWDEAMDKIHAVLPDGSSVVGMEVFRRTYKAIGLGWIYAPTAWPGLRPVFDRVYDVWAANRLTITGRPKCGKDGCELKL
eukprot:tig00020904_g15179.t1